MSQQTPSDKLQAVRDALKQINSHDLQAAEYAELRAYRNDLFKCEQMAQQRITIVVLNEVQA